MSYAEKYPSLTKFHRSVHLKIIQVLQACYHFDNLCQVKTQSVSHSNYSPISEGQILKLHWKILGLEKFHL